VVVLIPVYLDFLTYASGIYRPHEHAKKLVRYQAVVLEGYDDTTTDPSFTIKNSWGSDWGENGYAKISQEWFAKEAHDTAVAGMPYIFTPPVEEPNPIYDMIDESEFEEFDLDI
jgi:hypothetical protein